MGIFRCDFLVDSDVCLPENLEEISTELQSGHQILIRNGDFDEGNNVKNLVFIIIGEAEAFDVAHIIFRDILIKYLDVLTFVTQTSFKHQKVLRLIDWSPRERTRNIKIFETYSNNYPKEPRFVQDFLSTATEVDDIDMPQYLRLSMKYFRSGFLESSRSEQFMRFWLALEIIAENTKPTEQTEIPCVKCGSALTCTHCGHKSLRRPMATEAIKFLISNLFSDNPKEVADRQINARNSIMHGRSIKSIEKKCEISIDNLVNELAFIVHSSIMSIIPLSSEGAELHFGRREDVVVRQCVYCVSAQFNYDGEESHPPDKTIPTFSFSLKQVE